MQDTGHSKQPLLHNLYRIRTVANAPGSNAEASSNAQSVGLDSQADATWAEAPGTDVTASTDAQALGEGSLADAFGVT
eukprot:gene25414-11072_t